MQCSLASVRAGIDGVADYLDDVEDAVCGIGDQFSEDLSTLGDGINSTLCEEGKRARMEIAGAAADIVNAVDEQTRVVKAGFGQLNDSVDFGFDRTVGAIDAQTQVIEQCFDSLSSMAKIGVRALLRASAVTRRDFAGRIELTTKQVAQVGDAIGKLERLMLRPLDIRVRELTAQSLRLLKKGICECGDARRKTLGFALLPLREASATAMGGTNPLVWFNIGYILWQLRPKKFEFGVWKQTMREARSAFDSAVVLYTGGDDAFFTSAVLHKAHLCYLLGEYHDAVRCLEERDIRYSSIDATYEYARYLARAKRIPDAINALRRCLEQDGIYETVMFGEYDFVKMRPEMLRLIRQMVDEIVTEVDHLSTDALALLIEGEAERLHRRAIGARTLAAARRSYASTMRHIAHLKAQYAREESERQARESLRVAQIEAQNREALQAEENRLRIARQKKEKERMELWSLENQIRDAEKINAKLLWVLHRVPGPYVSLPITKYPYGAVAPRLEVLGLFANGFL